MQTKSKHAFYVQQLFSENRALYEIIWMNAVEPGRPQMAIWRMRITCWIPKVTNSRSQYVEVHGDAWEGK